MKHTVLAIASSVACLALATAPAMAEDEQAQDATEMTKGEKKLAKLLEGRVAGEPQQCIRTRPSERMRVIDNTAYVYGSGKTIYVQRTRHPDRIDRDDILVQRRFNATQLCKLDIVHTADRSFGFFNGAVFFDDFVPYTRVEQQDEG